MTRCIPLAIAAALAAAAAAAQTPEQPPETPAGAKPVPKLIDAETAPEDFNLARKKVVECEGEKFVFSWGAGASPTKVTICSKKGATTEELVELLERQAAMLEQSSSVPEDRRVAIVHQIRSKIAELQGAAPPAGGPGALVESPPAAPAGTPAAEARAEAPSPGPAPAEQVAPPPPPVAVPPPAPQPVVVQPVVPVAATTAARPPVLPRPRLSFECIDVDFPGGGPCVTLTRDTIVVVKSGEALASGAGLRFVRRGEARAEAPLGAMRKGQAVRLAVPRQVCSGVVSSEVEIQVTRGGQVVDRTGPYLLRC